MPEPGPAKPRADLLAEPRLAPLGPAQRTEEQNQMLSALVGDEWPNLFSTLARHPALFRTWLPFCLQLLMHSVFPPRERELLIIRTASLCGSAYELEHHLEIGAGVGLTDDDLAAVTGEAPQAWMRQAWTPRERLLVDAVDELHADLTISDATWRGLSALLTMEQLVELPMLVGHYILLAGTLRSLGVQLDSAHTEPNTAQ